MQAGLYEKSKEKEREKRLLRAWAHSIRARHFDAVARQIFVSQIDALHRLSGGDCDGKSLKRFHTLYQKRAAERRVPDEHLMDFQQWLRFLFDKGFVTKQAPGPYTITPDGVAFLAHVRDTGTGEAVPL